MQPMRPQAPGMMQGQQNGMLPQQVPNNFAAMRQAGVSPVSAIQRQMPQAAYRSAPDIVAALRNYRP